MVRERTDNGVGGGEGRELEVLLENKVYTVNNFLRKDECQELIEKAEKFGFKKSPVSGGGHGRTGREDARNNSYTVIQDESIAAKLFGKVKDIAPKDLTFLGSSPYFTEGSEWKLCGVVDRLRFYRYEKGECYPEHMDGSYKRIIQVNSSKKNSKNENGDEGEYFVQQSFLTLLIYLNEGFTGGETWFYPDHQHCRFLRDQENKIPTLVVSPKQGNALINIHSILHQGCEVSKGTKFVLRTDLVYQKKITSIVGKSYQNKLQSFNDDKMTLVTEWEKIFEPSCKAYHD